MIIHDILTDLLHITEGWYLVVAFYERGNVTKQWYKLDNIT